MSITTRRVVLVKQESTYGEDANPTPSANALLVRMSSSLSPGGTENSREHVRPTYSPEKHYVTGKMVDLNIECEIAGGGLNSTTVLVPAVDPLLQACGMCRNGSVYCGSVAAGETYAGEEISALTNTFVYMPRTWPIQHGSCTIYWYHNNMLHKAVGCRGTWSLSMESGNIAVWTFKMKGMWVNPVPADFPDAVLTDPNPPKVQNLGLTFGSFTPTVKSLSLDIGWNVGTRDSVNATDGIGGIRLSGRTPSGSIDPEMIDPSSFNPWTAWANGDTFALSCLLGSEAGNRMQIQIPKAQLNTPSYGEREDMVTHELGFQCVRDDGGDDELKLTFS